MTQIKKKAKYKQQLVRYTVKAEIHWTLEFLMSNYSYNSCSSKSELFNAMFSDIDIVEKFSMKLLPISGVSLLKAYNYYHFIQFYLMSFIMMP